MITQLIDKQDIEDKKQIGLFGLQTGTQILNPALTDDVLSGPKHAPISPKKQTFQLNKDSEVDGAHEHTLEQNQKPSCDNRVLHVDRNCLQCSGNMSQVVRQLKLACLSYTQSPVPYREKLYNVSDLLSAKAKIIINCQKLLREHTFKTSKHAGQELLKLNDENGFIIEPLLEVPSTHDTLTARSSKHDSHDRPLEDYLQRTKLAKRAN